MSRGSNGLRPIENLAERQKCPEAPTKRKFTTTTEAWTEARKRTAESGIDIAPYACAGCGFYHLTKKVTGSDTLTRQEGGKVVTGAQRKNAHPVFGSTPERVTLPEPEEEPMPGNHDARVKFALAVLEHNPEPTTADIQAACGCSKDAVRTVMHELGYRNTKGRHAVWRKPAEPEPEPQIGEDNGWSTLDLERINHMPIGDLIAAYRLIGVELRVQARP
ncbi:helix-turn-helix DNA binding domain protein [Microbacterium phage Margaery]|uniref:Helix-turn-helix DNA binding domain protein n=1 Tax=Microbacterium phage Margaery TaxID=2591217 RepID=A0A514DHM7_9CAUD|nr:helix-turn-helix DNA binding domain protein [Microbacterium phage Margaery]QDH93121.1 helix-turn-helix DNA binding domain protein [Microbacterium phage Margaery]